MELAPGQVAVDDIDPKEKTKKASEIVAEALAKVVKEATEVEEAKAIADALLKNKAAELKAAQEKAAAVIEAERKVALEKAKKHKSSIATADDLIFDDDLDDLDLLDLDFDDDLLDTMTEHELTVNKAALQVEAKKKLAKITDLTDRKNDALVADETDLYAEYQKQIKALNLEHGMLLDEIDEVSENLSELVREVVVDTPELLTERLAKVKKGKVKFEKEVAIKYDAKKAEYLSLFDENPDLFDPANSLDLYETVKADYPRIFKTMQSWQGDTNSVDPMGLRVKAMQMEGKNLDDLVWRNESLKDGALKAAAKISDDEYLSMRALNQAWMEKNEIEKVELFRGCLLYTSPSPRDVEESRMPSSA